MSIIAMLLQALGSIVAKVLADVFKDILKTPAKEISIEDCQGKVDLPATPIDDLDNQYKWLLDRG